ncbi:oligosaccharide flippase family protein [Natrononativus amylolyticus]|uniref:oligosaccharide flippase family protein n=1 Tax=Natrononativus amylolyticus TaxID=2963434 RepID=UPI0020CFB2F5|nr:oligosaccharide flippase family protein [Natrononativus amylolyticus]
MSLSEKIASGFRADLLTRIVQVLAGGLLTVALARLLGADAYGLLFFAISFFSMVTLLGNLGTARSAARYISEYEQTDTSQIRHILRYAAFINAVTIGIVSIVLVVFRSEIAVLLDEPGLEPFLVLGVAYVVSAGILGFSRRTLQGFRRIEHSALTTGLDGIARPVLAIGAVLLGFNAIGAFVGYILSAMLAGIVGVILLVRSAGRYELATSVDPGLGRRILEYSLPLSLTTSSDVLIKHVDTVLIGALLTPFAVSQYVVGKQIIHFAQKPAESLGFTVAPRFSEQCAKGNREKASELYATSLRNVFLLYIPAALGLIAVAGPLVVTVFGAEYAGGEIVVQLLAIYLVAQTVTFVTSSGLDYLGKAKLRAIVKGGVALVNFGLNLLLIPRYGVAGAAVATAGSYSVYAALNVFLMNRELSIPWQRVAFNVAHITAVSGAMFVVIFPLSRQISGLVSLISVVALGVGIWGGLCLLTGLVEPDNLRTAVGR